MTTPRVDIADLITLTGAVAITSGVALLSVAWACIVGGALLIGVGLVSAAQRARRASLKEYSDGRPQ